jgi:hypothetical protein
MQPGAAKQLASIDSDQTSTPRTIARSTPVVAERHLPAYAGAVGTTIAEVSAGPIGIGASIAGAVLYLGSKCLCPGGYWTR